METSELDLLLRLVTKPTVKGGLAPANAVVCEGKGMLGVSVM